MKILIGLFSSFVLFLLPLTAQSQEVYILFDPSCMQRLEYTYGAASSNRNYVQYRIQLNNQSWLILDVGNDRTAPIQSTLPNGVLSCNSTELNPDMYQQVKNNVSIVFMLYPVGNNSYKLCKVLSGGYLKKTGSEIVYNSDQYRFAYDMSAPKSGDLSNNDPRGKVFFVNQQPYQCLQQFTFRLAFNYSNRTMDINYVSGIGVIGEKTSGNAPVFQLATVNDMPLNQYVQQLCNSPNRNMMTSRSGQPPSSTPTSFDFRTAPGGQKAAVAAAADPRGQAIVHEVKKGETLIAIARKYNLNLDQLRQLNDFIQNSNLIKPGQEIVIQQGGPSGGTPQSFAARSANPFTTSEFSGSTSTKAWRNTSGMHTVRPGENVATLAAMYGYTEERFRDMNNLAPNQDVSPGQQLKTNDCDVQYSTPAASSGTPQGYGNFNLQPTQSTSSQQRSGNPSPGMPSNYGSYNLNNPSQNNNAGFSPYPNNPQGQPSLPSNFNQNQGGQTTPQQPYTLPQQGQQPTNPSLNPSSPVPNLRGNSQQGSGTQNTRSSRSYPPGSAPTGMVPKSYSLPPAGVSDNLRARSVLTSSSDESLTEPEINRTNPRYRVHVVRAGETVRDIARRYGMTETQLRDINDLEADEVVFEYMRLNVI